MRNGQINATSPKEDIVGALTGTWNEYDSDGWHVVVTPFFTVLSGTFKAETVRFPFRFSGTCMLKIANGDGTSENRVIKALTNTVTFAKPCLAEMTVFGDAQRTNTAKV